MQNFNILFKENLYTHVLYTHVNYVFCSKEIVIRKIYNTI